jgi:polysaccharide pyruvyl transferase WcaK-like protein
MKILFVGAYNYGNVGDEMYKEVFTKHLPEHQLFFDSPYPNLGMLEDAKLLVIGGGGLIYDNPTYHFQYMSMYLEKAIELGIPYAFVSCGIQTRVLTGNTNIRGSLFRWKKYIEGASLITVRSQNCRDILLDWNPNIIYCPDLGYLAEPVNYHLIEKDSLVMTQTGQDFLYTDEYLNMYKHLPCTIISMSRDDDSESERVAQAINAKYLRVYIPGEAVSVMRDAKVVVSGRYHGIVFARSMKTEVIRNSSNLYKSNVEIPPIDRNEAMGNIEELRKLLK